MVIEAQKFDSTCIHYMTKMPYNFFACLKRPWESILAMRTFPDKISSKFSNPQLILISVTIKIVDTIKLPPLQSIWIFWKGR